MPPRKPDWEVRVYGSQQDDIDIDAMTHIVIMLARELQKEAQGRKDKQDRPLAKEEVQDGQTNTERRPKR